MWKSGSQEPDCDREGDCRRDELRGSSMDRGWTRGALAAVGQQVKETEYGRLRAEACTITHHDPVSTP